MHAERKSELVNAQKGLGFLESEGGGPDVFVHISAVERAGLSGLNDGQKVSFEVATERGKLKAANLKLAWTRWRSSRLG